VKKLFIIVSFLTVGASLSSAQSKSGAKPAPKSSQAKPAATTPAPSTPSSSAFSSTLDSVSYAIGANIAQNLKTQGLDNINMAAMMRAMDDVMKSKPAAIDAQSCNGVIQKYFQSMQAKKYDGNKSAGAKFLAENKSKSGVFSTASGLQYQILKAGDGPKPLAIDKVKVHYHGTTIDGQVFDSSVDRGEPISFQLNGLIQGWIEGIQLMPVGSKWKFFLPYNLAYGESGSGAKIPPYSALIFDVELIAIEK
jgi:FKBP-type peptidyl-prolyl cis-trans isomerase FklB